MTPPPSEEAAGIGEGERIAKVVARAGLGSRRDVERWIAEGRVSVNGEVLASPARNVTESDTILVDGKPVPKRERTRLWLYHKPRGLVTTEKDPEGRPTVFERLPAELPRVMSIGRLDINTEGLLLLTNDGGLARMLELPRTGWLRRYRVRVHGETDQAALDRLADGITVGDVDYGPIEARLDKEQGSNAWLTLGLREGKNREVKTVLASLGLDVNRLIRVSYGPFQLGDLADGAVDEIPTRILKEQLGEALAREAGCEFDAPIFQHGESEGSPRGDERPRHGSPPRRDPPPRESPSRRAPSSRGEPGNWRPGSDADKPRRRGLRLDADGGGGEGRIMRGGLIEDRRGHRVLVQRVSDERQGDEARPHRQGRREHPNRHARDQERDAPRQEGTRRDQRPKPRRRFEDDGSHPRPPGPHGKGGKRPGGGRPPRRG